MFETTYLWLGTFAILATSVAMRSRFDWLTRFLAAVFALAGWAVWTISSLEVTVVSSGVGYAETYVEMAALGAVATLLLLIVTVRYAFAAFRDGGDGAPEPTADFKVRQ